MWKCSKRQCLHNWVLILLRKINRHRHWDSGRKPRLCNCQRPVSKQQTPPKLSRASKVELQVRAEISRITNELGKLKRPCRGSTTTTCTAELCHFGWSNSKNLPRGATVPGFSTAFPRVSALVCCDAGGTDASARAETRAPHLEAGREHMRSRTWGDEESEGSPSLVLTNSKVNGKR